MLRAAISTAPASAVPIEAPRLVTVFCNPPTSPLCSSETEDTVTLPSCDASAPTPRPASSIGQVTMSAPAPASSAATITTIPANSARNPSCTTLRGEASGHTFGMPAAASSSVIDSGSSRTPVSIADSPSATDRNSGTAKNRPACRRYWKKNEVNPPRSVALRRIAGLTSGSCPRSSRRFSHCRNSHTTSPPAEHQPDRRGQAEPLRGARLGLHEPPGARAQDPEHDQSESKRRQRRPDQVEPYPRLGRRVLHAAGEREDHRARSSPRPRTPSATTGTS